MQLFSNDTFLLSECPCDGVQCACACMWECMLHACILKSMTQSRPLISPLVDVVFQLLVQLVLLDALFPLCKCLIPLKQFILYVLIFIFFGRLVVQKGEMWLLIPLWRWSYLHGGVGHCFIFVVRHFGGFSLSGPLSSQGRILAPLVKSWKNVSSDALNVMLLVIFQRLKYVQYFLFCGTLYSQGTHLQLMSEKNSNLGKLIPRIFWRTRRSSKLFHPGFRSFWLV